MKEFLKLQHTTKTLKILYENFIKKKERRMAKAHKSWCLLKIQMTLKIQLKRKFGGLSIDAILMKRLKR
jgi:hypothetical protein